MAKKEKAKTYTREELIAVAEDMTISMILEPPVMDPDGDYADEEILEAIDREVGEIRESDRFLSETIEFLREIGIDLPAVKIWTKEQQEAEKAKQAEDKDPAGEQPPEEPPEETKPEKKPAPEKATKMTRAEVFAAIFDTKPIIKERLVKEMVDKYGGKWRQAQIQIDIYMRLLIAMGLAKKVGDKYSMKEIKIVTKGK